MSTHCDITGLVEPRVQFRERVEVERGVFQEIDYYYVTHDDEIPHLMAWCHGQRALGIDTETSGVSVYDHFLATLQIGNPFHAEPRAYVLDVRCLSEAALAPVRALMWNRHVVKLGHNVRFECLYLTHRLKWRVRNVADTQIAEMVIRAGLFKGEKAPDEDGYQKPAGYRFTSMAKCTDRYLHIELDKDHDLRTSFYKTPPGTHNRRQIVYAAGDTIYPWYIAKYQRQEIEDRALRSIIQVEFEIIPILAETELHGIGFDQMRWLKLWREAVRRQDIAQRRLDAMFLELEGDLFEGRDMSVRPLYMSARTPQPMNWSSPQHVKWAIQQYCQKIGWSRKILTTPLQLQKALLAVGGDWMRKKGITREAVIEGTERLPDFLLPESEFCILLAADYKTLLIRKLRGQLPAALVDALFAYQKEKSLVTTFGKDFLKNVKADGRLHTDFHQLVSTGRMSTSPNLQNIPHDPLYRECFRPRKGYKFVILDYSQIEPRISAYVSRDEVYLRTYELGDDLYLQVAEAMLGYRPDKETGPGAKDRAAIKAVVLGMAYAMGAGKLRDSLTLTLKDAVAFDYALGLWKAFRERCAGLMTYQELCSKLADPKTSTRKIWDRMLGEFVTYIESPCSRKRFFPPDAENTHSEACNMPIQGCSATQIKAAIAMVQRHIDDNEIDAQGCNYVHDEGVWEVREDQAAAFAREAKAIMQEVAQHYIPGVTVVAEFPENSQGVVDYWCKKAKDEDDVLLEVA